MNNYYLNMDENKQNIQKKFHFPGMNDNDKSLFIFIIISSSGLIFPLTDMGSITPYTLPPFLPVCTQSNKQPSLRLPTIPQQLCWHDKEWCKHSNDKLQCCI